MPEYFHLEASIVLYIAAFLFTWYLFSRMDIHNASRVWWNASGNIFGKVAQGKPFKRRASDSDFQHLQNGDDTYLPSTPENRDGWDLISDSRNAVGSADDLVGGSDFGHFSETEFLARFGGGAQPSEKVVEELPDRVAPTSMPPGEYIPELSEASIILDDRECSALAAAVPIRHRWRKWHLLYSSGRDGLSLQTLYRQSAKAGPSILVIRDGGRHVFGSFCSEGWKVSSRYYGTGESFVFQIQPNLALWRWYQKRMILGRNDFFQFGTPDCLAMGGSPAYAFKLDGDLVYGRSGVSETFGNAPLASSEEFEIGRIELWGLY